MKKTRRMKVTVETERLLVISRRRGQLDGWCEACHAEVRVVGVEEAALVANLGQRAIFRWIESGRLHFTETPRGALLICLESLLEQTRAIESE
jgi:hypothetical protein